VREQLRMGARDREVVDLDGQRVQHALDEGGPPRTVPVVGELDPHEQLGGCHGRDGDVVVVTHQSVQAVS
jgi:hypothetical protein